MKYLYIFLVFLFTGCGSTTYNWQMAKAPNINMIGRIVQNGIVGERVIPLKKHTLDSSNLVDTKNLNENEMNERLNLYLKSNQYTLDRSKPLRASNLQQHQIKDFGDVLPIGQTFIYKCVTAKEIAFTIRQKSGTKTSIISELSKITSENRSKISLKSITSKDDKKEIMIKKPKLCLSHSIAQFSEKKFENHHSTTASMFVKGKSSKKPITKFTLELGEKSNHLYIKDFQENSIQKNYFSLEASKDKDQKIILKVCKSIHQHEETCHSFFPNDYAKWNKIYPLGYEGYTFNNKQIYNIFSLEIDAESINNRSITVNWAKLRQPLYELKIQE